MGLYVYLIRYSNSFRRRLMLMLLSILRVPFQMRTTLLAAICVLFFAVSGKCSTTVSTHAHGSLRATHRHLATNSLHAARHTSGRGAGRIAHDPVARSRVLGHRSALVRARMPIRHYAWMNSHASATSARFEPEPATETVSTSSAVAQKAAAPTSATSIAGFSDAPDNNAQTPQDAANQIAAAEIPMPPHAALRAPAAASDTFRSTKIVAMAPLRGSLESLIRQNVKTNADNLERIEDDADLNARISNGQLVRVPESAGIAVDPALPENRRYCRPWTAAFLSDLSRAHQAQFHRAFEVSSAVRTVEFQKRLMRTNHNAAPAEGDVASPHLTGATIDIAKKGLNRSELYWMRNRLNSLEADGKIDVEEEFRQSCFHITVYKSYIGAGPAHKPLPQATPLPMDDPDSVMDPADSTAPGA